MLEVSKLSAWHGAAQALFVVSLPVGLGELVVLRGLKGAGPSTLLQAIRGLGAQASGIWRYQGQPIENWQSHRRAQASEMDVITF